MARELESISEALRIPGSKAFGPVARSVRSAESTLSNQLATITKAFADEKKQDGLEGIEQLKAAFKILDAAVDAKDKSDIFSAQQVCLQYVGQIQEAMVKGFPFEVCQSRLSLTDPWHVHGAWCTQVKRSARMALFTLRHPFLCRCQRSMQDTRSCSAAPQ